MAVYRSLYYSLSGFTASRVLTSTGIRDRRGGGFVRIFALGEMERRIVAEKVEEREREEREREEDMFEMNKRLGLTSPKRFSVTP